MSLLPPLGKDDYERLKASIAEDGQQIPILIDADGQVIDGAHRLKICTELEIEPWIEQRDDLDEDMIISLNLARRQMSLAQKKELIRVLRTRGKTQEEVAKLVGISRSRLSEIEEVSIVDSDIPYIPDLRYKITSDQREEIRNRVDDGEIHAQVAADYGISRARVTQIVSGPAPIETPPWPEEGRYRCIVLDPPWPMKKIERETVPTQAEYLDYPTMTLEEIQALDIPGLASPAGCHIYLWATQKFLHDARHIFAGWGARDECVMVWKKEGGFSPYSWQYNCEFILFGRIGRLTVDRMGLKLCFEGDRRGHSTKPDEFYQLVRWASPLPRINMFARQEREGFEGWGGGE